MVGSFSSTNKTGKARAAAHLRVTKNSRKKKERFGCGMRFSDGHSNFFLLEGGWWLSRINIPNQTWPLPMSRVQRRGYAKQHPQSILQYFSNSVTNKQQASKIGSLYPSKGFLLLSLGRSQFVLRWADGNSPLFKIYT